MLYKTIRIVTLVLFLILVLTQGESIARAYPSANIPLTSYIYDDLEKLDGLGLIEDMRKGSRPYTRSQAVVWVRQASIAAASQKIPKYAERILDRLKSEFQHELSGNDHEPFRIKEASMSSFYEEKATPLPYTAYNNGNKYSPHANGILSLRLEGHLDKKILVSLTPRLTITNDNTDSIFETAYAKTQLGEVEVELGKDSLWWGQGFRGSLLLTNNAPPLNLAVVRWRDATLFYSILENNRGDVPYPSFAGVRNDFKPAKDFTWGLAVTSMFGGKGHMLNGHDYWRLVSGENSDIKTDKWNTIAGLDFRWRFPKLGGIQLYGEIYGEDQTHVLKVIPVPSELAELVGVYIPRLSKNGDWDARLEWANTRPVWYHHALYTQGYSYYGDILGDAMGGNARRYSAKFTHYTDNGTQYSLNVERLTRSSSSPHTERNDSAWLAMRVPYENDCFLQFAGGLTRTANFGYKARNNTTNRFMQITFTKTWL